METSDQGAASTRRPTTSAFAYRHSARAIASGTATDFSKRGSVVVIGLVWGIARPPAFERLTLS
jgi:hypothetical protein